MFPVAAERILNEHTPRRVYQPSDTSTTSDGITRKGLHFGQRKLLLSEVEFFTGIITVEEGEAEGKTASPLKPPLVVYAGAANGQHLPFLFSLFPKHKFVLIDPAPFCQPVQKIAESREDGPIVDLINECCTDEVCERLRQKYEDQYRLILVSDIRSGVPVKMTSNAEHTEMIDRDNSLQLGWCNVLKPTWAMLKFHPPYPAEKNTTSPRYDPNDTTPEEITYLGGDALFGVWAPKSSSEVRLVVRGPFPQPVSAMQNYHCLAHEERCYYYNCSNRYQRDCEAERGIWANYLRVMKLPQVDAGSARESPFHDATVESLSAAASQALRYPDFLPLSSSTFSEDHARFLFLVDSVKAVAWEPHLRLFYNTWKSYMTISSVEALVRAFSASDVVPSPEDGLRCLVGQASTSQSEKTHRSRSRSPNGGTSADCSDGSSNSSSSNTPRPSMTPEFWAVFCRGNFAEAYSISQVRWGFYKALPPPPGLKSFIARGRKGSGGGSAPNAGSTRGNSHHNKRTRS